ncbi:unnamed protein product [Brugia timori]|uniref:Histone domain-containing protein n=1 Tax=Brugia timori TaxID=42155 RepID=A0A0R3R8Z1_9BILA|nr:unnamed protein product [Brugia timori]
MRKAKKGKRGGERQKGKKKKKIFYESFKQRSLKYAPSIA